MAEITPILTAEQCRGRIKRLAHQIREANDGLVELNLIGIIGQGAFLAVALAKELAQDTSLEIRLGTLEIAKHTHPAPPIHISGISEVQLLGAPVVLVDDVLNTGRTLMDALCALMAYSPPRIQLAVLVARNHSQYPIAPDFVGHTLSTTLEEHIVVRLEEGVFLS